MKTKIWAHRGASAYAPENTLEAFQLAVEQFADGIELDVQLSADGELVVVHDEKLERVSNGKGFVKDHTLKELKSLDFSKTHPEYGMVTIPTLEEVYDLIKPTELIINVELKTGIFEYEGIEKKCVKLENKMRMNGRILYSSFNHCSMIRMKRLNEYCKTAFLYSDGWIDVADYAKKWEVDAIHPVFYNIFTPKLLDKCNEYGIDINVWTVDDEKYIKQMADCGVNAMITNKPHFARSVLNYKK